LLRPGGRGKYLTIPIKAAISGRRTIMSKKDRRGNRSEEAQVAAELAAMQERTMQERQEKEQAVVAVLDEETPEVPAEVVKEALAPEKPKAPELTTLTVKEAGYGEGQVDMETFQAGGLPVACNVVGDDGVVVSNQQIVFIAIEVSNDLLYRALLSIEKASAQVENPEVIVHRGHSTTKIVAPADMPQMVEPILIGTTQIRGMSRGSLGKRLLPLTPVINKSLMNEENGEFSHTTVLQPGFGSHFAKVTVIHFEDGQVAFNLERWRYGIGYRREEKVDPETGEKTGRQAPVGPNYWEKPDGDPIFVSGEGIKRQAAVILLGGKDPDEISDASEKARVQRRLRGLINRLGQILDASFKEANRAGFKKPRRERTQFGSKLEDDPILAAAREAARLAQQRS